MRERPLDFTIPRLGEARIPSPMASVRFTSDDDRVLYPLTVKELEESLNVGAPPPAMEAAGPRARLFFNPERLGCGDVTCGGWGSGLIEVFPAAGPGLPHPSWGP